MANAMYSFIMLVKEAEVEKDDDEEEESSSDEMFVFC